MAEILQANDNFIRVSDLYKRVIGDADSSPTTSSTATSNGTITTTSAATTSQSGATATATASGSDILIDLADLDLGPPPSSHPDSNTTSASGSLLDSLGLLSECVSVSPIHTGNDMMCVSCYRSPSSNYFARLGNDDYVTVIASVIVRVAIDCIFSGTQKYVQYNVCIGDFNIISVLVYAFWD